MDRLTIAKTVVDILVPVVGLGFAIFSAYWVSHEWRYQHLVKEWGSLVQFLLTHAAFMDAKKNEDYKANYKGEEALKYEMVARLCVAYLDDVYHLRLRRFHKDWLVGTIPFLAGTHRRWLEDNKGVYSSEFFEYLSDCLDSKYLTPTDGSN